MIRRLLLALVPLALLSSAVADHPECPDESDYTVSTPAGTYYVVNDLCQIDGSCLFSVWVYEESNGHPGLQRGDEICSDQGSCDPCAGTQSDTIIF